MYGIINICAKDLICEKYGETTWEKIRSMTGVDDKFVNYTDYDDDVTYKIIEAAAEILGCSPDEAWELFGVFWVVWCMRRGYDALFRTLGGTLFSFLSNLDYLHSVYMKTMYPNMTVPSFRVEEKSDGNIILHYYSNRRKLGGIVLGIVKAVSRIIFNTEIHMQTIGHREMHFKGKKKDYYRFLIMFIKFDLPCVASSGQITDEEWEIVSKGTIPRCTRHSSILNLHEYCAQQGDIPGQTPPHTRKPSRPSSSREGCPNSPITSSTPCLRGLVLGPPSDGGGEQHGKKVVEKCRFRPVLPERIFLDGLTFCTSFPYHVIFNADLGILHSGLKLQQFCPGINREGARLDDVMRLNHPEIELTSENILLFIHMIFMVSLIQESSAKDRPRLTLRGQMIRVDSTGHFLFLCSPILTSMDELHRHQMHFSDIAPHDVTRDLILFNQQRMAEVELAKELEQKKEEMRSLMRDLAKEKQKTDSLLFSMLPKEVANDLREGRHVQAGEFPDVTIMFSDIVKFTDICSQCEPIQVVHFLNDMYVKFDELTTVYNVYKVETIGDAYMVVGGLPVFSRSHAERVVSFGLGSLDSVKLLKSPVSHHTVQIRLGVHTGPVVAGVVGQKMPRYCLFGDTVNTASRMESHGAAGKIHASETVIRALECLESEQSFKTSLRGNMHIKGKGQMNTYFITKPPPQEVLPTTRHQSNKTAVVTPLAPSDDAPKQSTPPGIAVKAEDKSLTYPPTATQMTSTTDINDYRPEVECGRSSPCYDKHPVEPNFFATSSSMKRSVSSSKVCVIS